MAGPRIQADLLARAMPSPVRTGWFEEYAADLTDSEEKGNE
jgi:hypothetical protein